ncbi:MAG TPA: trypsin-like serine protease, partial [Mycobacteriales bacterium]|nr:trypsin-like serine protease [Mycobacteriales bacterium]
MARGAGRRHAGGGGNFTVMGWGATREGGPQSAALRKATVPFVSDASCGRAYSELAPASVFCAGFQQGGGGHLPGRLRR